MTQDTTDISEKDRKFVLEDTIKELVHAVEENTDQGDKAKKMVGIVKKYHPDWTNDEVFEFLTKFLILDFFVQTFIQTFRPFN